MGRTHNSHNAMRFLMALIVITLVLFLALVAGRSVQARICGPDCSFLREQPRQAPWTIAYPTVTPTATETYIAPPAPAATSGGESPAPPTADPPTGDQGYPMPPTATSPADDQGYPMPPTSTPIVIDDTLPTATPPDPSQGYATATAPAPQG